MTTKPDPQVTKKRQEVQDLAYIIKNDLEDKAKELTEYAKIAWVLHRKIIEITIFPAASLRTTARDLAADIEFFGALNGDYLGLLTRDAKNLIKLLHELENLEKRKPENANNR